MSPDQPAEGDPGKLLVHQLLMSEAFGYASDESLQTETLKDQYRKIYRKDSKDATDEHELKRISDQIGQRPVIGGTAIISFSNGTEIAFLRKLLARIIHPVGLLRTAGD